MDVLGATLSLARAVGLRVRPRWGAPRMFPQARDRAYTVYPPRDGVYEVVLSPRMRDEPDDRALGVILHELGHVACFVNAHPRHSEREADQEAEALFGVEIRYDDRDLVQTLDARGIRPRPRELG